VPAFDIRQCLVVEVDRVLRRQDDPQAVGAGLLQQGQQRQLRRGVRGRRQVAEHLVHVEERAQARGAGLAAHPAHQLVQQERDEEHPLGIAEVGDGKHRQARLAPLAEEQPLHVERLAFGPGLERGRREEIVDLGREGEAFRRREEGVDFEHADARDRRRLDLADQLAEIQASPGAPGGVEKMREQDVFAALDRVGIDAEEAEQARRGGGDPPTIEVGVGDLVRRRRIEAGEDRQRPPAARARGVDGEVGGLPQPTDAIAVLAPRGQSVPPGGGLLFGEGIGGQALAPRIVVVDPRPEVARTELGKRQQQIPEVSLRIDHQRWHAVDGRLFEEGDAEPGLAASGHADDHRVRHEVARVVEQRRLRPLAALEVGLATETREADLAAEIERSQLLEVLHGSPPRCQAAQARGSRSIGQGVSTSHPEASTITRSSTRTP
jgi:hypothetical protein